MAILIDGLILSSYNDRFKADDDGGSLLLGDMELRALERNFPGIGIRWRTGEIIQVPPRLFTLTVTESDKIIIELTDCEFIPPGPFAAEPDSKMTWVHFKDISDSNNYCRG